MSCFVVNDYLDSIRLAGYQRFAVLLGDFSDPNFLDCLFQVLRAYQLLVCHLNLHNSPQVLEWFEILAVLESFHHTDLVLLQTFSDHLSPLIRSAILHDGRVPVDVHVQIQLLFEQIDVLGTIHIVVRRMKYRPAVPQDTAHQTILLGGCFAVATTYLLSK